MAGTTNDKNTAPAADEKKDKNVAPATIEFDVTLANGNTVHLEAIRDRDDLDLELLEHAQRGNYAVFLAGALTDRSNFMLKAAGAKVRDYEAVSTAYGEAVGAIEGED